MMCLEWEMFADSNSRRDFLPCMDLIKVAREKLRVCLKSNIWEKRAFFGRHLI